jgi:hypothetical protein
VPVSVADLAKYYADNPPPKRAPLAELEARLEALRTPGYRSPFKFDTSLGAMPFGTSGPGIICKSMAEVLNGPSVPNVASRYPILPSGVPIVPGVRSASQLFARAYQPSPRLSGAAKAAHDAGIFFSRAFEKWGIRSLEETAERWIDALGSAKPAELHPLELAAYEALGHLMAGRIEKVNRFLRRWLRIPEPDVETHEAMMRVLDRKFERRLSDLENPAAWLRQALLRERAGILAERDQADTYSQKLAEELAAEEAAYHEPGKTFYLPPSTTYVSASADSPDPFMRSKNTGLRPQSAEDPGLLVPNKHGSWRQAVEELANSGRRPTQERARLTLEYRQELEDREVAFSRKEFLRRIGGTDAERALKEAARTRHKQILEESA